MAPADPDAKIACPTPQHLQTELEHLTDILSLGEKEETWEKLEKVLYRFAQVVKGGGYKHQPMFTDGVGRKGCGRQIAEYMLSDRGRLSAAAIELLQAFAPRLGSSFAPLVQVYFDPLVKLFGRPNKVFLKRSEKCLMTIIDNCHVASIIVELRRGLNDEAATCRKLCSKGIERALGEGGWGREIWSERSMICLEEGMRKMATDKDPEVRTTGKRVWSQFSETFPERVDQFSAPLTPTIRRYLNLPAAGGVPAKAKAKAVAPTRPAAAPVASSSHASKAAPPAKVQHQRVAALVTKSTRSPIKHVPSVPISAPVDQQVGPSRPHRSPVKIAEARHYDPKTPRPRDRASPPVVEYHAPVREEPVPQQAKLYPMPARRPEAKPLSNASRSVSHNVLPTTAYTSHSAADLNPLSNPARPGLVQSYSTTALSDTHPPPLTKPGRFATGPMRIVRPAPMSSTEGQEGEQVTMNADGFFYTPSGATVLRGPSRPPPAIGHNRRPMGQAQRRVVTAPGAMNGDIIIAKTPAATRVMSRNVREKIDEADELPASPAKEVLQPLQTTVNPDIVAAVSPVKVIEPLCDIHARVRSSLALFHDGPATIPAELAAQIPLPAESPKKPRQSLEAEPLVNGEDEGHSVLDKSILGKDGRAAVMSNDGEVESKELVDKAVVGPAMVPLELATELISHEPAPVREEPQAASVSTEPVTTAVTTKPRLEPRAPPAHANSLRTVSGRSDKTPQTESSKPATAPLPPRKPPVPRAAAVTRLAKPADRKPFRPTTAAESAAARIATAKAATRPPAQPTTKASESSKPAESGARARVPSVSASSPTSADLKPQPPTRAEPAVAKAATKPSTLLAPTKSSTSRAGPTIPQPTHRVVSTSAATPATTAASSTSTALPPVRKERIKLKAALPSFRPVRQGQGTTSSGPSVASTFKPGSTLNGGRAGVEAKPESVPLPTSPADKDDVSSSSGMKASTSPSLGSGRARVRPESLPPRSDPRVTQPPTRTTNHSVAALSPTARVRPEHIPLATTPTSKVPTLPLPSPTPTEMSEVVVENASRVHRLNNLGLPLPITTDRFESSRSKVSDAPTDSDSETDDEVDDLEGVTFKTHSHSQSQAQSQYRPPSRPKVVDENGTENSENPTNLSDTPNKVHAIDSTTTPKYTPGRKALVFRDANVRSQGGLDDL